MDLLSFRYTDFTNEAPVVFSDPTPLANAAWRDATMVDLKDRTKSVLVYKVTCLITKKSYIGITSTDEPTRWAAHLKATREKRRNNRPLYHAIRKHGPAAFVRNVLYVCVDGREAIAVERGLIAQYGTLTPNGYNLSSGGENYVGVNYKNRVIPESHKEHLRHLAAGMKGKKRKPESIEKGRQSLIGHFVSKETRARIGAAKRGKAQHTEESKARISKGNSGLVRTAEQKEKMGAGQAKTWADPERKAARLEKNRVARQQSGYSHSEVMKRRYRDDPVLRASRSEHFRALWNDPEVRERMLKGRVRSKEPEVD